MTSWIAPRATGPARRGRTAAKASAPDVPAIPTVEGGSSAWRESRLPLNQFFSIVISYYLLLYIHVFSPHRCSPCQRDEECDEGLRCHGEFGCGNWPDPCASPEECKGL